MSSRERGTFRRGFTLVELLVVIAIIGILAALLLPVLNKAKHKAWGAYCMSNHKHLLLAWKMYVDDNNGHLPYASENPNRPATYKHAWVCGTLDFNPYNRSNWDPAVDIYRSPLWTYCGKNLAIWKCPADKSGVTVQGEFKPRVRSMSMNVFLGGWGGTDGGWGSVYDYNKYLIYMKESQLANPSPSTVFVFTDVREDSIDMGNFATDMRGWPNQPQRTGFIDLPASYHARAGGFSFADGHSEMKAWQDESTMPPVVPNTPVKDRFLSPNNLDVVWLQEHASRPR